MAILAPLSTLGDGGLKRLRYEASVRQRIQGPSLLPVIDQGEYGEYFFVVNGRPEGETLQERLQRGVLNLQDSLFVGKALFAALQSLHFHRVTHRDIRASNIYLKSDPKGRIEKLFLRDTYVAMSISREIKDSFDNIERAVYSSPEQSGAIDVDVGEPSDLYSAGIVLYHCLCGMPPFIGTNVGDILFEHMTAAVPDLCSSEYTIPRVLNDVIQRLLQKDPRNRYQLAEAVTSDLEAILRGLAAGEEEPDVSIGSHDQRGTLVEPSFLARQQETSQFDRLIENLRAGLGTLCILEGESGLGKSRFIVEMTQRARRKGIWVLRGQTTWDAGQQPFRLLDGIVRGLIAAAEVDPTLAVRLRDGLGSESEAVCAALPDLRALLGIQQTSTFVPEALGEVRTIQSLATLLDLIGSPQVPALIVLDDLQWADEMTFRVLQRWLSREHRKESQTNTAVVAAFRSEEVDSHHSLRMLPSSLHICLRPFASAEIRQIVESMAGSLPEDVVHVVVQLAAGSPFMASAVLRGLVETAALTFTGSNWQVDQNQLNNVQSSEHAGSLLCRRIDMLPATTRRLLAMGAVLGREFTEDVATNLADLSPAEAATALYEARQRHLVWAKSDGASFVFVHDKVRSTLVELLTDAERNDYHLLAAEYLRATCPDRISELAFHYDACGKIGEALPFALEAAEQARSQYALEISERQFRIADRGASTADAAKQFRIASGLGDVLMLRGNYDGAAPFLARAESLASSPLARSEIKSRIAELAFKRGDMKHATDEFEAALRILGRFVPRQSWMFIPLLLWETAVQCLHTWLPNQFVHRYRRVPNASELLSIRLLSLLARGCWYSRGKTQCLWAHLRGMNLAERFPPTLELANAYSEHAPAICLVPLRKRAEKYALKSLALRKQFGDLWGQGQTLNFYSCVLYYSSRYTDCIARARESIRLLERMGDYWQVHIARYQLAASLYRLGEFSAAISEAKKNHESGVFLGDEQASGIILDVWARANDGKIPEGVLKIELARTRNDAQGLAQVQIAQGRTQVADGQLSQAQQVFEQAFLVSSQAGICNAYTLPSLAWLTTTIRRRVELEGRFAPRHRRALICLGRRAARRGIRGSRICENDLPHLFREFAQLEALAGNAKKARRLFRKSIAIAETHRARHELAETLLSYGEVGQEVSWGDAETMAFRGQKILSELQTRQEDGAANSRAPESIQTLSLVDRFDTLLQVGREIASGLSKQTIYRATHQAAMKLLRGE
ncbi:MAG: AAA family ATPase, partial [Planctomycetota bacterium]|nr:AAA family ATPase [Planctomycetota bacterium]